MESASCLDAQDVQRVRLDVSGAVQGVGFRPFVYRLAVEEKLAGFVRNTVAGVTLEVEGPAGALERFQVRLHAETRPPARIQRLERCNLESDGQQDFFIQPSDALGAPSACVLPDLAVCAECRAELFDPANRRYRYPFTTCTHCGPRYSIIEAVPYDRSRTSMRHFVMCPACRTEYTDPASRRFHAETNACPDCGPQLALYDANGTVLSKRGDALEGAAAALREGCIVGLKGLGGFQLLVDARNEAAVARLRERKHRPAKPFAVMAGSIGDISAIAHVSAQEHEALISSVAPIVLLRASEASAGLLASGIAPGNPNIGLMLPATPLHCLLLDALGFPVVATSGNRSGEPMAANDEEAFARLAGSADLFLTHDRPIVNPADDSVMRRIAGNMTPLRCARGLAPLVLADPQQDSPVLALGGHMKNAVALGRDGEILLGPHIGDLAYIETRAAFARSVESMQQIYGAEAAVTAIDAHPDYHTTRIAKSREATVCPVQHHHAHILSVMVENGLSGPVLGLGWDGTGFGVDGTVWGGEFLQVEGSGCRRVAHFLPFRLPGGEAAVKEPRRTALGALHGVYGGTLWDNEALRSLLDFGPGEWSMLRSMIDRGLNAPVTSSLGRLFDAVAAILNLCRNASFDGEAAMAVEFAAESAASVHPLPRPVVVPDGEVRCIDWRPMLTEAADAFIAGVAPGSIAAGFHHWLAEVIQVIVRQNGSTQVVLSGGCFQNALLTGLAMARLQEAGSQVYRNIRVPPNDGGLAVGQAAYAARWMNEVTG